MSWGSISNSEIPSLRLALQVPLLTLLPGLPYASCPGHCCVDSRIVSLSSLERTAPRLCSFGAICSRSVCAKKCNHLLPAHLQLSHPSQNFHPDGAILLGMIANFYKAVWMKWARIPSLIIARKLIWFFIIS